MAPNKKKKKPMSNPARGFSTTSMASKPKSSDAVTPTPEAEESSSESPIKSACSNNETSASTRLVELELHELSPEELEIQLEESDLQLLLEKYGEKSKKTSSRQVSRLQTERRMLRLQAERLSTHLWLPVELMQLITDNIEAQMNDDILNPDSEAKQNASRISEEDMTIKLWTLKQVLVQLGFCKDKVLQAVDHLLKNRRFEKQDNLVIGTESIWGLDECLDWLALTCEPQELPDYDSYNNEAQTKQALDRQRPENSNEAGTVSDDTPLTSRPTTPSVADDVATNEMNVHAKELICHDSDSESESDMDPLQLTDEYLSLQTRLYAIRPDLTLRSRETKLGPATNSQSTQKIDLQVTRLLRKLSKIKSDILFDQGSADEQWIETRNRLVREAAERRKLQLDVDVGIKRTSNSISPIGTPSDHCTTDSEDTAEMLGDLFSSLPDTITNAATGTSSMIANSLNGDPITVRLFEKWNGINPRRILEEACRARDSASKISYKLVSASSFSNRHSLLVQWSRNQDLPSPPPIDSVSCKADHRSVRIEMVTISTPDAIQSEAYVSTVALFLIFAAVPKEEKAYLRLPPTWRDLWAELLHLKKDQVDRADRESLRELRGLVTERESSNDDRNNPLRYEISKPNGSKTEREATNGPSSTLQSSTVNPEDLKMIWSAKVSRLSYQDMLASRMTLPIWSFKDELLSAVEEHQVVIVCGETGCGKSTQVPAFILEHELSNGRPCKIYCTEPRRISAISLARRVNEELGERKSDVGTSRSLVGFAIRLESQLTTQTRLVYATTGIVMRMLERSEDLGDITHLVLDEVHERSIDSDFLLIVLRNLMKRRPGLKVLLMSATVNAQRFSKYLSDAPILDVPGRTFPVETKFLEDAIELTNYTDQGIATSAHEDEESEGHGESLLERAKAPAVADYLKEYSAKTRNTLASFDEYHINYHLIVKLLETVAVSETYASYSKAILVFLPGIAEIRRLNDTLLSHRLFSHGWDVFPLHSTIASDEQERAFLIPSPGMRKIVLATNIAETGITIPDVTCVIDTGKHKEMRFDERRQLSRLLESFISRANAKQRRGRAGRVQNGLCFHLFTRARHDSIMAEQQTPEILRLSLQDLVLRVKICRLGNIEQTLSEALDPPSSKNIRRAIDSLVDVKALTAAEALTPLGRQLARLPLDVFLGKLVLLGSIFHCLDGALTIAAILSSKSPFLTPIGARSQADLARLGYKRGDSDLLTVYSAYCAWRRVSSNNKAMEHQFCRKNFLSQVSLSNIEDLKAQLTTFLVDSGFLVLNDLEKKALNRVRVPSRQRQFVEIPDKYNFNNDNDLILNSVIAWSFYPKLLRRDGKGWRNAANNQSVSLHPTSVNKGSGQPPRWLSFYHIMQSSNKFYNAHETSPVEDFAIALACGDAEFKMYSGIIIIDGNRARFSVENWKIMLALKYLRMRLREIMSQSFRSPGRHPSPQQQVWLDIWEKIFFMESRDKH